MTDGPSVRWASPDDAAELARLRWEFSPEHRAKQPQHEFVAEFSRWMAGAVGRGDWFAAVAELDKRLVGTIWLGRIDKVPRPGRFNDGIGHVTNSYVENRLRRQGIGTVLLSAVVDRARELLLELLIVWPSEEALSFYTRAGFVPCADAEHNAAEGALQLTL